MLRASGRTSSRARDPTVVTLMALGAASIFLMMWVDHLFTQVCYQSERSHQIKRAEIHLLRAHLLWHEPGASTVWPQAGDLHSELHAALRALDDCLLGKNPLGRPTGPPIEDPAVLELLQETRASVRGLVAVSEGESEPTDDAARREKRFCGLVYTAMACADAARGHLQQEFEAGLRAAHRTQWIGLLVWVAVLAMSGVALSRAWRRRRRSEEALRESQARLVEAQRVARLGSWEWDVVQDRTSWSESGARVLGLEGEECPGGREGLLERVHPDDRAAVDTAIAEALEGKTPYSLEHRVIWPNGTEHIVHHQAEVTFDDSGKPVRLVGTVQDVTRQRELEAQVRQAQRMEAIGALASGVAHDFNNILTGILGQAEILSLPGRSLQEVHEAAEVIRKAAGRGAELARRLLSLGRRDKLQSVPVDVHETCNEVAALLRSTIDRRIAIKLDLRAESSGVSGDPGEMQQMLLNLGINGADAMPEGGTLEFRTETVELDNQFCSRHPGLNAGRYVALSVSDTGHGIPKELQDRIFEPFFTTKPTGEGTGLGLSMAYRIVRSHGGVIEVESQVGVGTRFTVYLPALAEMASVGEAAMESPVVRGSGRILLVDDEEMVRGVMADALGYLGYEVATAADGQEAVEYYRDFGGQIDLVIIDLGMPRMDGRQCFQALKAISPNVKALLATGYGLDNRVRELLGGGVLGYVQKPFRLDQLSQAVAEALRTANNGKP